MAALQQLVTQATNERGILVWAYAVSASSGYGRGQDLGMPYIHSAGGATALDAHADAAWVLQEVSRLPMPPLRHVVAANYGSSAREEMRLCLDIEDIHPTIDAGLIAYIVRAWCGGYQSSERETCRHTGLSARTVSRDGGAIHGALNNMDWMAISLLGTAFRAKGWLA